MLCGGQVDDVEDHQVPGGVSPCPKSELGRVGRKEWDWNILCESCYMLGFCKASYTIVFTYRVHASLYNLMVHGHQQLII